MTLVNIREKWTISRWDLSALYKSTILPEKERHCNPYIHCSYENKIFNTGSRKSCNEDTSMGKAISLRQIFFRWYGGYDESRMIKNNQEYDEADTENQKDFSDDIKVRSNFKVNHASYFCEETF